MYFSCSTSNLYGNNHRHTIKNILFCSTTFHNSMGIVFNYTPKKYIDFHLSRVKIAFLTRRKTIN